MKAYAKAYLLHELMSYPDWSSIATAEGSELADDDIVYIADDFTVLADPIGGQGVIVDSPTEEWQRFCATSLDFAVPEDLKPIDDPSGVGANAG